MKRDIIKIDEELCNGCGECVPNCHEGALQIIDGKAKLVSDMMCDGLGACLGHCPQGAITIEKRDAEPFDELVVAASDSQAHQDDSTHSHSHSVPACPGSGSRVIEREHSNFNDIAESSGSELRQWPVQMHLVNPAAPYFRNSDLLVTADCVAYSTGGFHSRFLKGKSLVIACPKLDQGQDIYVGKLKSLIDSAHINTITVMIMEVPCCGGLLQMVRQVSANASRKVPVKMIVIGLAGEILKEDWV